LPHPITISSALSPTMRGVFFNNDAELQNCLDDFFTIKPADLLKHGIENLPGCSETVVNNGGETKLNDYLIICVKNKFFESVKKPHELMHQPNRSNSLHSFSSDFVYLSINK
jgi:hypothetical protein